MNDVIYVKDTEPQSPEIDWRTWTVVRRYV